MDEEDDKEIDADLLDEALDDLEEDPL